MMQYKYYKKIIICANIPLVIVLWEAMKKNNTSAALSKLDETLPCLFFVCTLFYFVIYYKSFASTDIATNQM